MIGGQLRGEERVRATRRDGEECGRAEDHDDDGEQNGNEANAPPRTEPGQPGEPSAARASASHRSAKPGRQRLDQQLRCRVPQQLSAAPLIVSQSAGMGGTRPGDARRCALLGLEEIVGVRRQRFTDPATFAHAVALVFRNWSSNIRRPREMRDITVPIGTSSIFAISAYENSSTSRIQTAWRNTSGNSSSAARRSASSVFRAGVARASRSRRTLCRSPRPLRGGSCRHRPGRLPPRVPDPIPPRVVQDRREPGSEVRAGLELVREAQRLDERILHQVFGIGPVPGQPQRRRVQRLEVTQNLRAERVSVCRLAASEHRRYRDPLDRTRTAVGKFLAGGYGLRLFLPWPRRARVEVYLSRTETQDTGAVERPRTRVVPHSFFCDSPRHILCSAGGDSSDCERSEVGGKIATRRATRFACRTGRAESLQGELT